MRVVSFYLTGHRSVEDLEFEAGAVTVLFGRNNAGKTNILETVFGILSPDSDGILRRTVTDRLSSPRGALVVDLERGIPADEEVGFRIWGSEAWPEPARVSFTSFGVTPLEPNDLEDEWGVIPEESWGGVSIETPSRPSAMLLDWSFINLHERVVSAVEALSQQSRYSPWLEPVRDGEVFRYQVPSATEELVSRIASLATDLLPDFVDGAIRAHVTAPDLWQTMPKVLLEYEQRGATQCSDLVDAAGSGAARWIAAAVQVALQVAADHPGATSLRDVPGRHLSHYLLLVDEPEAHLHPGAVGSIVRWCSRMARHGVNILVASHHEAFLRAAGDAITLVHVTRDADLVTTAARTLPTAASRRLLELAEDVGVHPVTMLSLHSAILFVEGPLDEAVLDEFAGLELDAAGVKILPVHGTKNLEGIVAAEIVTDLAMRLGILTDATDPETMEQRSNKKKSSEEKKVLRVLKIAEEKGLPVPTPFGVVEEDLLFVLPTTAIRNFLQGPFPGWKELVEECRKEQGMSPSDSVNWKLFARERYGLPLDSTEGVREIVRSLDLAGVELPSLRRVVDQIVEWAAQGRNAM